MIIHYVLSVSSVWMCPLCSVHSLLFFLTVSIRGDSGWEAAQARAQHLQHRSASGKVNCRNIGVRNIHEQFDRKKRKETI